jgi:hypothetical protein
VENGNRTTHSAPTYPIDEGDFVRNGSRWPLSAFLAGIAAALVAIHAFPECEAAGPAAAFSRFPAELENQQRHSSLWHMEASALEKSGSGQESEISARCRTGSFDGQSGDMAGSSGADQSASSYLSWSLLVIAYWQVIVRVQDFNDRSRMLIIQIMIAIIPKGII